MIDQSAIKTALHAWIVTSSDLANGQVIFKDQNAPSPQTPFIAFKMMGLAVVGHDEKRATDGSGIAEFLGQREFTVSISYYGENSLQVLNNIRDSLEHPNTQETLMQANIIFSDTLMFDDISEFLETKWQERGQLDLLFRTFSSRDIDVGFINKTTVTGTFKNPDGSTVITDTNTIQ